MRVYCYRCAEYLVTLPSDGMTDTNMVGDKYAMCAACANINEHMVSSPGRINPEKVTVIVRQHEVV